MFMTDDGSPIPNGWTEEEWDEFQEYFESLSCQEQEIELKSMMAIGKAKKLGKNVIAIEQYYEM
jgi:hypothetical protein